MNYTPDQIAKAVRVMESLGFSVAEGARSRFATQRDTPEWLPNFDLLPIAWECDNVYVMNKTAERLLSFGYFDAVAWRLPTHPKWDWRTVTVNVERCPLEYGVTAYWSADTGGEEGFVSNSLTDATLDLLLAVLPMLEGE
jgi:hypothetical protein